MIIHKIFVVTHYTNQSCRLSVCFRGSVDSGMVVQSTACNYNSNLEWFMYFTRTDLMFLYGSTYGMNDVDSYGDGMIDIWLTQFMDFGPINYGNPNIELWINGSFYQNLYTYDYNGGWIFTWGFELT